MNIANEKPEIVKDGDVTEYRFPRAVVRIHGNPPKQEVLEKACIRFMAAVEAEASA